MFFQEENRWEHIVWTNDKKLIPISVEKLESNGIKVREISEVKDHLVLYDEVVKLIKQGRWGMATDGLRYDLVYYFGGVYADVSFKFYRVPEKEIHRYDFLKVNGDANNFFIAKANHPILQETLRKVKRNFNNPPEHVAAWGEKGSIMITYWTTVVPFQDAYYNFANSNNTVDARRPYKRGGHSSSYEYSAPDIGDEQTLNINSLKKYIQCNEDVNFFEKRMRGVMHKEENEICGLPENLIGSESGRIRHQTWVNEEWDL